MSRSIALFSAVILGIAPAGAHPAAGGGGWQVESLSATARLVELAQASSFNAEQTRQIQLALKRRGYDPGPADGLMGRRTSNAIRAFQADHGLAVTGMVSRTVYELLVPEAADAAETSNGSAAAGSETPVALTILGRRFDLDLSHGADEPAVREPAEVVAHLPADLAESDEAELSEEDILGIVEERAWAARSLYEDAFQDLLEAQAAEQPEQTVKQIEEELSLAFAEGTGADTSPQVQTLYDRHLALSLVARGLRRSLDHPDSPSGAAHFTVPDIPADVREAFERQGFDPEEAYRSWRLVRAAYRSGELSLLARVADYPLLVNEESDSTTISRGEDLTEVAPLVMNRALQEVALEQRFEDLFVRDQGAMFGDGALWLTPECGNDTCSDRLTLQSINVMNSGYQPALSPDEAMAEGPGSLEPEAEVAREQLTSEVRATAEEFCRSVHSTSGSLQPAAIEASAEDASATPDLIVDYRGIRCDGVDNAPLLQGGFCGLTSEGMKCQVEVYEFRDGQYVKADSYLN